MSQNKVLSIGPPRTYALVLGDGESVVDELVEFAESEGLRAASITAIGAFSESTLAYFDVDTKKYVSIPIDEQVEVLSFTGDIARGAKGCQLHAHVVVGRRDGSTRGGHLRHAIVRPALEVMMIESPSPVYRRYDEKSGLALMDLDADSPADRGV